MTASITPRQHRAGCRRKLRHAGFMPIPVNGKAPAIKDWQTKTNASDNEIESWSALNTGLLTSLAPAFDIDIKDQEASKAVEALVRERFEGHGRIAVRIGNPPKRAILF